MSHIRGADRSEALPLPPALDHYIARDNPVRFIEAFALSLDLVELGLRPRDACGDRQSRLRPGRPVEALRLRLPESRPLFTPA